MNDDDELSTLQGNKWWLKKKQATYLMHTATKNTVVNNCCRFFFGVAFVCFPPLPKNNDDSQRQATYWMHTATKSTRGTIFNIFFFRLLIVCRHSRKTMTTKKSHIFASHSNTKHYCKQICLIVFFLKKNSWFRRRRTNPHFTGHQD